MNKALKDIQCDKTRKFKGRPQRGLQEAPEPERPGRLQGGRGHPHWKGRAVRKRACGAPAP